MGEQQKTIVGYPTKYVICPKHGKHKNLIESNIEGHEGVWCQICWLELLGEPLPTELIHE